MFKVTTNRISVPQMPQLALHVLTEYPAVLDRMTETMPSWLGCGHLTLRHVTKIEQLQYSAVQTVTFIQCKRVAKLKLIKVCVCVCYFLVREKY